MAIPPAKVAQSVKVLRKLQRAEGAGGIRARDLSRTHRERLLRNGFLQEVIKGWYIPSRPDEVKGESTAWYASFWRFCCAYLEARFGVRWCLSPEQSLSLHAGNWTVPGQLSARSPRAGNKVTKFPHGTSLLELRIALPGVADRKEEAGLRLFSMGAARRAIARRPSSVSTTPTSQTPTIRPRSRATASRRLSSSASAAAHGIRKPTRATANSGTPRRRAATGRPFRLCRKVLAKFLRG